MLAATTWAVAVASLLGGAASRGAREEEALPVRLTTRARLDSRLANIHVLLDRAALGGEDRALSFTYGPCDAASATESHHVVGAASTGANVDRLVWVIPEDVASGGCLSAWAGTAETTTPLLLVGRSAPLAFDHATMRKRGTLTRRARAGAERRRRRDLDAVRMDNRRDLDAVRMDNASGIDAHGPWFEGVALLAGRNVSAVDVAAAKAKRVAIVGAGMAGLTTHLLLRQAGLRNLSLVEGGHRLGGRVDTQYLTGGPWDYSYQEMGPMRFPHQITLGNATHPRTFNISDHQLVFQMAAELNALNAAAGHGNLSVHFIPWIQSNPNGLVYANGFRLPSGLPPTLAQIQADPSLGPPPAVYDAETVAANGALNAAMPGADFVELLTQNTWKAFKQWLG